MLTFAQLLWKRIETSYNSESFKEAEAWCHLALHGVFDNSDALNTGKLQRLFCFPVY